MPKPTCEFWRMMIRPLARLDAGPIVVPPSYGADCEGKGVRGRLLYRRTEGQGSLQPALSAASPDEPGGSLSAGL